jgi:L-ectoine synthase
MILRTLEEIEGSETDVAWGNGQSRRFLVEKDNMGFSITDTIVNAGTTSLLEYCNHMEACYCIEGKGQVALSPDGPFSPIEPGTMYALDKHDKHYLKADTTLRLVCVFRPALQGYESHQLSKEGSSSY